MKRILISLLPMLILVTAGFAVVGIIQVRFQEEKLLDDLKRKAKNVVESMELSARNILLTNDIKNAQKLADKFQRRERLQGCIFFTKEGKIFAYTDRISEFMEKTKRRTLRAATIKIPDEGILKYNDASFYYYKFPIPDDQNEIIGLVEVVYDTSYIYRTTNELWRRLSIILFGLLVLLISVLLIIQRQIFTMPMIRLTEWFRRFQKGEIDNQIAFKDAGEFAKLASEVEQVALGLRVARRSVSIEASNRIKEEELWNEAKLKDLVRAKLGENTLFVVSNREPYMHVLDDMTGKVKCIRPASGVVTALDPILKACGGMWIAQGSGQADKKFVNSKSKLGVPPEDIHYILKRIWLSKEEENGYYYGFSNEGLWPLCHITHTRPVFREKDWDVYKKVNAKFAESILEELPSKTPFIFIQDYHFTLLPKMIKAKRPDAIVAMFWHIPWPNPEVFSICPYQDEILDGMLSCDLIGFHLQFHCNNFIDTCNRLLESRINTEKFSIIRNSKETLIRAFPISVDVNSYAGSNEIQNTIEAIKREYDLDDKIIGIGVERIDYTKGLIERMLAIEKLFEKYPQYRKKVVYIQLAAPSRTHIKRYHELMGEIDEVVERINWKYSDNAWKPIIYLKQHFSSDEIGPYYAMADFCIVSSLHDGMNLVAKEYIASKTDYNGVLILSCFTGAARELVDAIQINPYSIDKFADAIRFAIEMPKDEKVRRMKSMHKIVTENNVYRWAGSIINELTGLKKEQ
jgi:trehalose-6-phosphate synthase